MPSIFTVATATPLHASSHRIQFRVPFTTRFVSFPCSSGLCSARLRPVFMTFLNNIFFLINGRKKTKHEATSASVPKTGEANSATKYKTSFRTRPQGVRDGHFSSMRDANHQNNTRIMTEGECNAIRRTSIVGSDYAWGAVSRYALYQRR